MMRVGKWPLEQGNHASGKAELQIPNLRVPGSYPGGVAIKSIG